MRFSAALLALAFAALFSLLPWIAMKVYSKKTGDKISWFHFLLGMVVFIIILVAYYLVLRYSLARENDIGDYFNTAAYRLTVISIITAILFILLWIFARLVYIRRQNFSQNLSFFAGLGVGGTVLVGLYCALMFFVLLIQYFSSTLLAFDEQVMAFYFSSDTYISVFTPIWGHVSFAIAMIVFWISCVCFGLCMNKTATMAGLPVWASVLMFFGELIGINVWVTVICFMNMFRLSIWSTVLIVTLVCVWCVGIVLLSKRFKAMPTETYERQFD